MNLTRRLLPNGKSRQRGTSLIEILVSIFVLAIGMLGMAGMAAVSSGNNKLAQIRSTANLLVSDYADRARANLPGFDTGQYEITAPYTFPTALQAETGCTNASTAACAPVAMAALDEAQWLNTLMRRLPGGNAYVLTTSLAAGNERTMDIWIMWTEAEAVDPFGFGSVYVCPAAAAAPGNVRCLYFRVAL
jgi:type IV pilus assembly protein PilV